ncbi:hypothetical protein [Facklamia miroungae]|uniref:Uncharacterized protein n=1 Tax=Facklamia miroungae TaxID=120956 RepID=A0A1G7NVU7_9LACT|nr:hypothetical protein [Facklamia miroungae]NKZ28485.1 hypothetical protein [Facklamia miroungae]SDF78152.1 hypothetical protein SAMN05421791_10124 [Facklamia miroungae]
MQTFFRTLFYFLGIGLIVVLLRYRTKKFSFINDEVLKEYPITRYKVGTFILCLWLIIILFGIFQELVLNETINSKIFLMPFIISVVYSLFGATPTVAKSTYKINLTLDIINSGSLGMDLLGSWVGEYNNGLIVYFYLIDYNSIELSKLTKEEIVFSGIEKQNNIPINVTLKSKPSIHYFYPLLNNLKKSK